MSAGRTTRYCAILDKTLGTQNVNRITCDENKLSFDEKGPHANLDWIDT